MKKTVVEGHVRDNKRRLCWKIPPYYFKLWSFPRAGQVSTITYESADSNRSTDNVGVSKCRRFRRIGHLLGACSSTVSLPKGKEKITWLSAVKSLFFFFSLLPLCSRCDRLDDSVGTPDGVAPSVNPSKDRFLLHFVTCKGVP